MDTSKILLLYKKWVKAAVHTLAPNLCGKESSPPPLHRPESPTEMGIRLRGMRWVVLAKGDAGGPRSRMWLPPRL